MPSAGVASKAAPATIATAMATTRQREGGRVGVPLLAPARSSTSSQSAEPGVEEGCDRGWRGRDRSCPDFLQLGAERRVR